MEPYEETIDTMFAVAKILGRLHLEGHIDSDELAIMQKQLMKSSSQDDLEIRRSPFTYEAPVHWMNPNGTQIIRTGDFLGVLNGGYITPITYTSNPNP
jgi:hypothetical protein